MYLKNCQRQIFHQNFCRRQKFHTPQAYFIAKRFHLTEGQISLKKDDKKVVFFYSGDSLSPEGSCQSCFTSETQEEQ